MYPKKESSQSCLCTNSPELTMKISMCSVNVCGLISKLIYTILQDYMKEFDAICSTETKCDLISDNEINGFKSFIMPKKQETQT